MSLYERLGVGRGADAAEIRRAYLRLSKTAHPDKGGSEEEFKKIQQAYEILTDDQKRGFYDQTGQIPGEEESGGPGGPGGPFPFDLGAMFGGMFGGMPFGGMGMSGSGGGPFGGFKGRPQKRQKAPPKIQEIGLTLHDYFYGKSIQIKFGRQKFCEGCKGSGAENYEQCAVCRGAGFREQAIMIGPGMMATSRGPCGPCGGEGKTVKTVCKVCNGMKMKNQEKVLTATIEPGMKPGDVLKFERECSDQHEYEEPGDVHIIMRDAEEPGTIKRDGDSLKVVLSVPFMTALVGGRATVEGHPAHPEGLVVTIPTGSMRGDTITVAGEGMPRRGAGASGRGNLYVTLAVELTAHDRAVLEKNKDRIGAMFMEASP